VSSAILYLAIIAIWACVLIPRWLRRDSARGSSHWATATVPASGDVASDEDVPHDDSPRQEGTPPPLTREESHRRMMAARRRLLGILLALEAAAIGLAMMGLAALWVVIPPSVMFGGYLLLLREAAHADAERAQREEETAWARHHARSRARAEAARRAAAAPAAPVAPARPAADFEDSGPGRDFAPGLAGKYTTSNGEVVPVPEPADEDFYDQYPQHRLRAVGD
jgi:hypothetical protein